MEEKALETLRTMLRRRGLDTKTDRIITDDIERVNLYTIGNILVVFSQKDNGVVSRDVVSYLQFANKNGYTNGTIVVAMVPPSENVVASFKNIIADSAVPIQLFHIRQLQFDITTHRMAMPHRILKEEEQQAVFKRFNVTNPAEQLPRIDSHDTMVKWIGAVPGNVVEITRHSDVAGPQLYYRYVVKDVNVA
jgi:DNA-directed RNA polymerase subunit H (RpoH/RPB5)